jgi:hypothetical protein
MVKERNFEVTGLFDKYEAEGKYGSGQNYTDGEIILNVFAVRHFPKKILRGTKNSVM